MAICKLGLNLAIFVVCNVISDLYGLCMGLFYGFGGKVLDPAKLPKPLDAPLRYKT